VSQDFEKRLGALSAGGENPLAGGLKGVEKEALRIDELGDLSRKQHPVALGSALTNRYITTDFSEALLEFVTPAFSTTWETLQFLCDIHQFTYENIGDELLWVASMPCRLPADADVPIARYGNSNVGRLKTVYRNGLGLRYGRHMQTIAGVHFNYSLPESFWPRYRAILGDGRDEEAFRSDHYLGLVRNFRRFGWLILYLSGASPAMCRSFAGEAGLDMPSLDPHTYYGPFATSLRMSDLGYSNRNQSAINISLNGLAEYIRDLADAMRTPDANYERLGVKVGDEYRQLSANRLQIENEYYSPIRPKRVARSGERPTAALRRGGVEYVEIRSLDVNMNDPAGVNQNTMRFIEAFLVYCLLEDSPPLDVPMIEECKANQTQTARRGRDPEFRLLRGGEPVRLADWAREIVGKVDGIAAILDQDDGGDSYAQAVSSMSALLDDPEATPSARMLAELRDQRCSYFEYILNLSRGHKNYFAAVTPLSISRAAEFEQEAARSIDRQRRIEAGDETSFDEFLARYIGSG
jgi:glutamate--cysteine ligase